MSFRIERIAANVATSSQTAVERSARRSRIKDKDLVDQDISGRPHRGPWRKPPREDLEKRWNKKKKDPRRKRERDFREVIDDPDVEGDQDMALSATQKLATMIVASEIQGAARKAKLNTPEFVVGLLNDWVSYSVRTFAELERNGVVKEDQRDKFKFWVGNKAIEAVGPGRGMYRMKWKVV